MMKGIIFDGDGILFDSFNANLKAHQEVLARYGVLFTKEYYLQSQGRKTQEMHRESFEKAGLPFPENIDKISDEKNLLYRKSFLGEVLMLPGVRDFLKDLKKENVLVAVATAMFSKNISALLEKFDLNDFFSVVVSGDDVKRAKPDPEIYRLAAEKLNLDPRECVVFEDAPLGVKSAKAAGMKVVGVLTGSGEREELEKGGADLIIETLNQFSVGDLKCI
ncbi:MAG: HAD family phosphatase [Candidatus Altiarchaeota archaeon]